MKTKWLLLTGVLAALVYVGTVILGGLLRPDYSHLTQPISELTATGAPNKLLLDVLFLAYNVLVIAFGIGVFQRTSSTGTGKLSGIVAAVSLIITGLCGALLQLFFSQDPGGAKAAETTTGTLHIVFAGIAALSSMIAMLAAAWWFRKQPELKAYVPYTVISFVIMLVSGGFGAGAATSGFSLFGVVERITIGTLIVWLFVISFRLYKLASIDGHSTTPTGALRGAAGD
ncbi:MAG: DUF998 domain-containing protein [Anaerolineae bacterium]|nr:DUF998 domain-containing protein [Anaerolineae bacterium]